MRRPHRVLAAALAAVSPAAPALTHAERPRPVKARKAPQKVPLKPYADHTRVAEQKHGLPRHVIDSILYAESRGNPKARNRKSGAAGVAQFTAGGRKAVERIRRARGEQRWRFTLADAMDPVQAIAAAAELLAYLVDYCRGSLVRALGAYNTGRCMVNGYARRVLRYAEFLRMLEEPRS